MQYAVTPRFLVSGDTEVLAVVGGGVTPHILNGRLGSRESRDQFRGKGDAWRGLPDYRPTAGEPYTHRANLRGVRLFERL